MRSYWFIRVLGALTILLVALVALTPVSDTAARLIAVKNAVEPADAIVVLGGGLYGDGELSPASLRRTLRGIELYKEGLAPMIVFSGPPILEPRTDSEAAVRARLAVSMGVPSAAILQVENALTTHEEAEQISHMMREPRGRRILLVTTWLHLRRAEWTFEHEGFKVAPVASEQYPRGTQSGTNRILLAIDVGREFAGLLYYKAAGYR